MTTEILSTITETTSNRRGLLGLMAKALALTTIPATGALAADDAKALAVIAETQENPELLALGEKLEIAFAHLLKVRTVYWQTVKAGKRIWPRAPEILTSEENHCWVSGSYERDITGYASFTRPTPWGEEKPISCWNTESLEMSKPRQRRARKPHTIAKAATEYEKDMAEWKPLYEAALAYEAEMARIREAVGYNDADREYDVAAAELRKINQAIADQQATTLAGIAIKAAALDAWTFAPMGSLWGIDPQVWIGKFTMNILCLDGRSADGVESATRHYEQFQEEDA